MNQKNIFYYINTSFSVKNISFDNVLTITSIVISTILSILIIGFTFIENKRNKQKEHNRLKETLFIVKQEVKDIMMGFHNILTQSNNHKPIYQQFYFSKDWRQKIIRFVPFLPEEVSNNVYSLYSFCEYSNENKVDFSRHNGISEVFNFVEINNIEYINGSSSIFVLANYKIRFLIMFLDDILLTKGKDLTDYSLKINGDYDEHNINKIQFDDVIISKNIKTYYENGKIKKQHVKEGDKLIRDVDFDNKGTATGFDTFVADGWSNYLKYFRRPRNDLSLVISYGKKTIYKGDISRNRKHGTGEIIIGDKLSEKGEYKGNQLLNGERYNVEINRRYKDKRLQDEYEYHRYLNSEEYMIGQMESQEADYEYYKEHEYDYISETVDQTVTNGEVENIEGTNKELKKGPYYYDI